ncbi:MAG TPA: MFS transporter, partial [Vicinamibacterales bacterium]|nr:MFS transporter [Vicinamibacterales bacterium]
HIAVRQIRPRPLQGDSVVEVHLRNRALSVAGRLDRLPISSFHRDIVRLLAYIFFFELGDLNSFAFAAPAVRQAWGLNIDTISFITSASFVGMFLGSTVGGWLSDRMGRKRALVLTTIWYSGFSFLNAFAWDVPSLFLTRLLTGVGLSSMTVIAMTYISEMFPARIRGSYQAWILTIGLCGIPVTAYVARFIIPLGPWGWRAVFVWGSLAILFPLFARRLEESPRWFENQGRFADAEAAMERIEARVTRETGTLPPVQASPIATARAGGFRELIASGSLGRLILLMSIWTCQTLGIYGFLSWVPTLLVEHGFSVVRSLEQSSAMSIGAVPGAWIASKLSDRWERKSLIGIVAVAIAVCGLSYGLSFRTLTIVIFGFLVAMGQQVFAALLYAYTPECFPTVVRNTGTGLSYGMGRLANGLVGPFIVAYLFQRYGYSTVFAYIALCWALVAILVVTFGPKTRGRALA